MKVEEVIAVLKEHENDNLTESSSFCKQKIQKAINNPGYDTFTGLKEYLERESPENETVQEIVDALTVVLKDIPKPTPQTPSVISSAMISTETKAVVIAPATATEIFEIAPTAEIKLHPYVELKPMPTKIEFERYVKAIKDFGQTTPVEFFSGQLINGLYQVEACRKLGIKIKAINWTGSEDELFLHVFGAENPIKLTAGQKAAYAVNLLPELERQAKIRMTTPEKFFGGGQGEAREIAARLTGSNKKSVSDMKKIKAERPTLFKEVTAGKMTVNKAMIEAKFRAEKKNPSIADELRATLDRLPDSEAEWLTAKVAQSGPAAAIYQERLTRIKHQLLNAQICNMREAS